MKDHSHKKCQRLESNLWTAQGGPPDLRSVKRKTKNGFVIKGTLLICRLAVWLCAFCSFLTDRRGLNYESLC